MKLSSSAAVIEIFAVFSLPSDVSPWSIKTFDRNFGRSLLAGYSDHYMSDFVLHGTSDQNFRQKMLNDLQLASQVRLMVKDFVFL